MNARTIVTELTANCRTMVDVDAVIARGGGIGPLIRSFCPERDEAFARSFLYELEGAKLRIRNAARKSRRYDEEV